MEIADTTRVRIIFVETVLVQISMPEVIFCFEIQRVLRTHLVDDKSEQLSVLCVYPKERSRGTTIVVAYSYPIDPIHHLVDVHRTLASTVSSFT